MLVLLTAAGAFVFWRVQVALDTRLDEDLHSQVAELRSAATRLDPSAAIASLPEHRGTAQLYARDGRLVASGTAPGVRLLDRQGGTLLSTGRLRVLAEPVPGKALVAVTAVRLDQRDEALRELLAQLAIADLGALAIASFVGYRFAHLALDPVERYRARAEAVARGATGLRLDVPSGPEDEVTRLGSTLNAMLDALERAAERQRQFIDDASHELRTPLATLSAEIDVALRKPRTAAEYETTLQRLQEDSTRIRALAETLLSLGSLGDRVPSTQPLAAGELLATAARRARSQLDDGRAVVVEPSDATVDGDRELLDAALGNLVDNAVRHGAGTIALGAVEDGRASVVRVHDEGRIDPSFLPEASQRFRRHEAARSSEGAGLGLALVAGIARAHGGQLRICSAGHHHADEPHAELDTVPCTHPEAGTTVSVLLPRTR